jgi:RNA polymerase sigma factor (sigma-70 family)
LSDGNYSLLKAVDKFDYSRGVRFSTYAYWAILKNFAKSIPEEHSHRKLFITGQEEIIEATSQKVEESREDEELLSNLKERLGRILNALNPRERSVILHRFGLVEGENPKTLAEIGKIFGLTRERIRQIEIKALGKLRAHLDLEVSRVALS